MQFTSAEIRLIALHARLARPLHETVQALAEALPEASPRRILDLAKLATAPEDGDQAPDDDAVVPPDDSISAPSPDESAETMAARHADELARCTDEDERADCEVRQAAERAALAQRTAVAKQAGPGSDGATSGAAFRARMARDPMVLGLNRAISELRGQRAAEQAASRVNAAIATGKIVPAQREWAIAYCTADVAGFTRFVGGQPALALAAEGPAGLGAPPRHTGTAALSADEARICTQTRTDPQKFLARRDQAYAAMTAQPAAGTIIRLELD